MSIPTSEKRFTRSQTREGTPMASSTTLSCASTPSSATMGGQGFSKAGRRVLADLACNDSPVIGLLPAGIPASCKQKSSSGVPLKSRRALLANPPSHQSSTPLGESLLRSQVQLLLQKVESDMCAPPYLRESVHPDVGNGFMVSPTMLAAPTPLNTPAPVALAMQAPQAITEVNVQNVLMNGTCARSTSAEKTHVQDIHLNGPSQDTFGPLKGHASSEVLNGLYAEKPHQQNVLSASNSFTTSVSMATGMDKQPLQLTPLLSEVSDVPSSTEIFPGKRVLHFDDETPCKAFPPKQFNTMIFEESGHHSVVRELDDDEVSEWSVHVNVGSPADKQSLIEQAERTEMVEVDLLEMHEGVSSSINEHVKNIQQESSSKVKLLWDNARERKLTPYRSECAHYEEEEEEADYSEQYYSGNEELERGEEENEGVCDNLCDMFREMRFEEEESKGLPIGEGKHIRFLYGEGEDEIVEAMVVKGEEDVFRGCTATRLNGVPVPLGRHWRFAQEGDVGDSTQQ